MPHMFKCFFDHGVKFFVGNMFDLRSAPIDEVLKPLSNGGTISTIGGRWNVTHGRLPFVNGRPGDKFPENGVHLIRVKV